MDRRKPGTRGAGAAAIPVGLVAVLDTVIALRGLAFPGPAHLAQAIRGRLAAFPCGAERAACGTAAVDSRFIVVSSPVGACRRLAYATDAHPTEAVLRDLARVTWRTGATWPTAVLRGLSETLIPLVVHTMHRDADHPVACETRCAECHIRNASDASAVIAVSFARLRACVGIWVGLILRLSCLASIHCTLGAVIVRIARLENLDEVTSPIAPEILAIPRELRRQLAEWFELKTANAILARRCPAMWITGLRAVIHRLAATARPAPRAAAAPGVTSCAAVAAPTPCSW